MMPQNSQKNEDLQITPSLDLTAIQKMAIKAGLEPGEIGKVIRAWLAKANKKVVGGIMLLRSGNDCTIEWLSVLKKYRDRGIGAKLAETAILEAKDRKFKRLVITMKIPEFFRKFGFNYTTMDSLSKDFFCYRCRRYNKSCFPVAMELNLVKAQKSIEIKEARDYPLLEKLAKEKGQETSREITRRIVKGWFAFKGKNIIGGLGLFKWKNDYTFEYSFGLQDNELVRENLMKQAFLFAYEKNIKKIYFIRGVPDALFAMKRFGFKEIHWRLLPPIYRSFCEKMCDRCPQEKKRVCHPVAMVMEIYEPLPAASSGVSRSLTGTGQVLSAAAGRKPPAAEK